MSSPEQRFAARRETRDGVPLRRQTDAGAPAFVPRSRYDIVVQERDAALALAQRAMDDAITARHAAEHDKDTALFNKSAFEVHYGYAQKRIACGRLKGKMNALVFIDGDGLKAINDTHGHAAGDAYLAAIAAALRTHTREGDDIVVRIGGDEFGVLMVGVAPTRGLAAAQRLADNVNQEKMLWQGCSIPLRVSMGVVLCGPDAGFAESLKAADRLMYENKLARKAARPVEKTAVERPMDYAAA